MTLEEFKRIKQEMLRLQEENEFLLENYDFVKSHSCTYPSGKKLWPLSPSVEEKEKGDPIRGKVSQSELCQFINQHQGEHDTKQLCKVLNVLRSTYCQSKHQNESKWKHENQKLLKRANEIYFESKRRYGAIKVYHQLLKEGVLVSLKRIQRLIKSAGLASLVKRNTPRINNLKSLF